MFHSQHWSIHTFTDNCAVWAEAKFRVLISWALAAVMAVLTLCFVCFTSIQHLMLFSHLMYVWNQMILYRVWALSLPIGYCQTTTVCMPLETTASFFVYTIAHRNSASLLLPYKQLIKESYDRIMNKGKCPCAVLMQCQCSCSAVVVQWGMAVGQ